jgi:hypothetical protein
MNEPIHAGCQADVIGGTLGDKSPNLGLVVHVLRYVGDDPVFGRMWLCEGAEYVETWAGVAQDYASDKAKENLRKLPPGQIHFAQDWLKKRPGPLAPAKTVEKELAT